MTIEKSLETRKDIDCLKFHTKTWLDHLEALESYHKNGEHCRANTRGRAERILTLGFSLFPTRSLITSTLINPLMTIGDL